MRCFELSLIHWRYAAPFALHLPQIAICVYAYFMLTLIVRYAMLMTCGRWQVEFGGDDTVFAQRLLEEENLVLLPGQVKNLSFSQLKARTLNTSLIFTSCGLDSETFPLNVILHVSNQISASECEGSCAS